MTQQKRINLTLPTAWTQLSSRQLKSLYRMIAEGSDSMADIKVRFLLSHIKARVLFGDDGQRVAVIRHKNSRIIIRQREIAVWVNDNLGWMDAVPSAPLRLPEIRPSWHGAAKKALSPTLEELSFEDYLTVDNYYQGYLHTSDISLLNEIEKILYPGIKIMADKMSYRHINIFYWIYALKQWAADRWPNILRRVSASDVPELNVPSARKIRQSIDSQIRALTKGDITKEIEVLAMPFHRALTELDALALESEQISRRFASSKK